MPTRRAAKAAPHQNVQGQLQFPSANTAANSKRGNVRKLSSLVETAVILWWAGKQTNLDGSLFGRRAWCLGKPFGYLPASWKSLRAASRNGQSPQAAANSEDETKPNINPICQNGKWAGFARSGTTTWFSLTLMKPSYHHSLYGSVKVRFLACFA